MTIFPEHDPYELAEQLLKCQSEVKRLRKDCFEWHQAAKAAAIRAEKAGADAELFGENLNRLGDFYKQYREKAEAELVLMKAERDGLGSQLLDVQQDCIKADARVKEREVIIQYVLDCDMAEIDWDAERLRAALAEKEKV